MDALYAHLHRSLAEPFVWSESDCMMDVANYLLLLTGHDCGRRFRGLYHDAASCQRVSGFLTDPVKPFADCMAEFPLTRIDDPARGDVAVIRVVEGRRTHAVGAIFLGRNWAVKAFQGLGIGPALDVLAAWRAPEPARA